MINIKMMTEDAYITLQRNYKAAYHQLIENPNNPNWLKDFVGHDPFEVLNIQIEDFSLKYDQDYSKVACENGITLYEALKDLPPFILYSQRFWAWINFEKAYLQAQKSVELKTPEIFKNFWVSRENNRREIMLGVISREFIKVSVSVDESRNDKYELTKYLFKNFGLYQNFIYRNIGMLKSVTIPVIQFEYDVYKVTNRHISKIDSSLIMKEASKIGSVMLIDSMTNKEIEHIIREKCKHIVSKYFN